MNAVNALVLLLANFQKGCLLLICFYWFEDRGLHSVQQHASSRTYPSHLLANLLQLQLSCSCTHFCTARLIREDAFKRRPLLSIFSFILFSLPLTYSLPLPFILLVKSLLILLSPPWLANSYAWFDSLLSVCLLICSRWFFVRALHITCTLSTQLVQYY